MVEVDDKFIVLLGHMKRSLGDSKYSNGHSGKGGNHSEEMVSDAVVYLNLFLLVSIGF